MNLTIDRNGSLVCIQMHRNDRSQFVETLRRFVANKAPALLLTCAGGTLEVRKSNGGFTVDATADDRLVVQAPVEAIVELIEAVQEHIDGTVPWPLDHPLEPAGATIRPPQIRDVLFETVGHDEFEFEQRIESLIQALSAVIGDQRAGSLLGHLAEGDANRALHDLRDELSQLNAIVPPDLLKEARQLGVFASIEPESWPNLEARR